MRYVCERTFEESYCFDQALIVLKEHSISSDIFSSVHETFSPSCFFQALHYLIQTAILFKGDVHFIVEEIGRQC